MASQLATATTSELLPAGVRSQGVIAAEPGAAHPPRVHANPAGHDLSLAAPRQPPHEHKYSAPARAVLNPPFTRGRTLPRPPARRARLPGAGRTTREPPARISLQRMTATREQFGPRWWRGWTTGRARLFRHARDRGARASRGPAPSRQQWVQGH